MINHNLFFYFPMRLLFSYERRLEEIFSLNFNTKVWGCLSRIIHDMKILYLFLVCLCLNVQKPCLYEDLNFRKVAFHTSTVYKGLLKNVANNFKKLRHSRYELGDERLNFMSFFQYKVCMVTTHCFHLKVEIENRFLCYV